MSRIPSDEIFKHVNDKYTGVIVTAKRAREILINGDKDLKEKPLIMAYDELMAGKLKFKRIKSKSKKS
ncbi:MAG: DNA-directed RNA polymerase subunit omega [Firmicutes bacterium]|jgi:DNA-directed RNA polymerase omega subunit|nr:DNA-directed RNA polymerase subunit omega [Bacillota bacterium]